MSAALMMVNKSHTPDKAQALLMEQNAPALGRYCYAQISSAAVSERQQDIPSVAASSR